jgi:hypothetical protein
MSRQNGISEPLHLKGEVGKVAFERYCFLRLYSIDLDTALQSIKVIRRYKRADVLYPLLRDIAVTYARPFSGNNGEHIRSHTLSLRNHVPSLSRGLHNELIRLRMQQFAHTDIKFYRPKVAKFQGAKAPWFPMAFKGYDYGALLGQLTQIEELIREVGQSIRSELASFERNF